MLAAAGRRPRAVRGRPLDAPDGRCGARGRLPAETCRRSVDEREAELLPRQQGALSLHRQPGRAAQRAGPDRRAASTRGSGSRPATRCIFSAKIIPGNERTAPQPAQPARPPAASRSSPRATISSTSPAIPAATSWSRCTAGSSRRSRCRSTARRATCTRTQRLAQQMGVPHALLIEQRRHAAPGARRARDRSTRCRWPHGVGDRRSGRRRRRHASAPAAG